MILIRDAIRLSLTKLKIRKVRLGVTVTIAALLFAGAVFIVTVVRGALTSVEKFNIGGLSNQYLAGGMPATYIDYSDPVVIAFFEAEQKALQARKKIEAKRLGIEYDTKTDQQFVETMPDGTKYLNVGLPAVQQLLPRYSAEHPTKTDFESFSKLAKENGAESAYRITSEYPMTMLTDSKSVIVDGKEEFKKQESFGGPFAPKGFRSIESAPVRVSDTALIEPFLLSNESLAKGEDGSYPVFVPFSVAEEALGLKPLPDSASSKEKIEQIRKVRNEVAGKTLTVCYRNETSTLAIQNVLQQKQELELNKNNKNYIKPNVLYDYPSEPCGPVLIVKDTRTLQEKKQQAKQDEFDRLFGKKDAESKLVTLRIVGITPDADVGFTSSVSGILTSIARSSVGSGWILPATFARDPAVTGLAADIDSVADQSVLFIAKVPDGPTLKHFINDLSCDFDNYGAITLDGQLSSNTICEKQDKYFTFMAYGNNVVAIDQFESGFNKFFNVVLLVVAAISSAIMMGTVARIIADSRRETAVFRSIGATRLDMSTVYGIYAFIVATLVIVVAVLLGWLTAGYFNSHFSDRVTAEAILVFNVSDLDKTFSFYAIDAPKILKIAGVAYLATLLGLVLPLVANLRRSPLKDMRDEN